jgi:hypothetical protein
MGWVFLGGFWRGLALTTRRLSAQVLPNTQETMIFLRGKSWSLYVKILKSALCTLWLFLINRLSLYELAFLMLFTFNARPKHKLTTRNGCYKSNPIYLLLLKEKINAPKTMPSQNKFDEKGMRI